ncbi:MAG: class I SAM-dependent methyltransferase [Candidatus Cyclobacteriaceae bacterium M2_1C_046]
MKKLISFLLRKVPRKYLQLIGKPILKVVGIFYRGNRYTCPVINKSYRKFLPYGRINPRPNALCPESLSLERHRLLYLFLQQKTNFFTEKLKIMHVAPELCFMDSFEKQHREGYITTDIESPLAKVKADIHDLPFNDNHFDVAICNHVLEHVENDIQAMKEIHRVLKPGGWAILQVPFFHPIPETTEEDITVTSPKERERLFGQDDHVRKYGRDYADRLRSAGFTVKEDQFIDEFSQEEQNRFALPKGETIYFCKK